MNNPLRIKINRNNPKYFNIIKELKKDPPILLAGSFVSTWYPTSLPNGQQIVDDLFELLFPVSITKISDNKNNYLKNIFYKVPFEHIFERCSNEKKMLDIIIRSFSRGNYNPVHKALIDGLIQNKIANLITTNYDLCFDNLISGFSNSEVKKIVTEEDIDSLNSSQNIYFKIHGSVDDNSGESIVFTLRHESLMPKWKRNLLIKLLSNKNLLVIGYSGLDFEICPEILRISLKRILWNNFKDEFPSPNSELVLKSNDNSFLLIGDMVDLISDLIYPISPVKKIAKDNFVKEIKDQFTESELNIWRVALLNSMGCPSIALKIIKSIEKNDFSITEKILLERQKAQALFHYGKYKDSAKHFSKSASIASDFSTMAELYLDSCDAYRCYGAFYRSFKFLRKAFETMRYVQDKEAKKRILGKIHMKRVLIYRQFYQMSKYFKKLRTKIRNICKRDLKISSKISLETGNWFEFQQIRWWADRLDIDAKYLVDQEHYEAPPPKFGYDQIGYHIAQSGVFRDMLSKKKGKLSTSDQKTLSSHIENCQQFGNMPEIWKLILLKLKFERKNILSSFSKFVYYFFKCQYRPLYRIYQLISGS